MGPKSGKLSYGWCELLGSQGILVDKFECDSLQDFLFNVIRKEKSDYPTMEKFHYNFL